jgi:hypothetical protein
MALSDLADDFFNIQLTTKSMNEKMDVYTKFILPKKICNIFEDTTDIEGYLQKILNNNQVISKVIKNNFLFKIRNFFQFSGVPIHIKSGKELDEVYPPRESSRELDLALKITPLGVFVPELQSIFLAGDRIAEVATNLNISYTNLAYIVRIHEIMHWLFQWKEKPNSRSREYEYIEESMANYMTLLWIDWLVKHIDDCPVEKFLLNKTKSGLKKDAITFMGKQPEAYAVAVLLYDKCNPFKNNNVLPFINWCFQKNKIKNENRTALVKNLRELDKNPENYSTNDIIKWYNALFA